MRLTNFLFGSGIPLLVLPALATPLPASYTQQEPLAVAHAAITEVSCAESCLFDDSLGESCKDETCRKSCSSFSAAYWSNIEQCINRECSTQTKLGSEYVENMKKAVESHCSILNIIFSSPEDDDEFYVYGGGTTDDPVPNPDDPHNRPPHPKPPCDGDGKLKPKKPKKHKDVPPPVRRRALDIDRRQKRSQQPNTDPV